MPLFREEVGAMVVAFSRNLETLGREWGRIVFLSSTPDLTINYGTGVIKGI